MGFPPCQCLQCRRGARRTENWHRRKAGLPEMLPIEGEPDPTCPCGKCEKKRLRDARRRRPQPTDEDLDRQAAEWIAEHDRA